MLHPFVKNFCVVEQMLALVGKYAIYQLLLPYLTQGTAVGGRVGTSATLWLQQLPDIILSIFQNQGKQDIPLVIICQIYSKQVCFRQLGQMATTAQQSSQQLQQFFHKRRCASQERLHFAPIVLCYNSCRLWKQVLLSCHHLVDIGFLDIQLPSSLKDFTEVQQWLFGCVA